MVKQANKQRMSRVRSYNELLHGKKKKKGFRQKEKGKNEQKLVQ